MPAFVKFALICLVFWLALPVGSAQAADAGIATIVDGHARLLRDTTWYKVVPGARIRQGDIVEAVDAAQVQVELGAGGTFYVGGPATLYAASLPIAGDKLTGGIVLDVASGWLKLAAKATTGARVQFPGGQLEMTEAIVVVHVTPESSEFFMESGAAKVTPLDAGGKPGPVMDATAGEYRGRSGERPFRVERHAPQPFVAAMPRPLQDPLPSLASRYKNPPALVAEREITYAEAEPWLTGPYRRTFLKQFTPRLRDRDFRAGVEAHITRYPEWDRILHPEKYLPKPAAETK
jgi:hypothetical protein